MNLVQVEVFSNLII